MYLSKYKKGTFPGIERQHRLLVLSGLAKPRKSFEGKLAAVEAFWKQWEPWEWEGGVPIIPTPPLNYQANKNAIKRLKHAWNELTQAQMDIMYSNLPE